MWALVEIKQKIKNIGQILQVFQNATDRLKSRSDTNLSILWFRSKINAYKKNERLKNKRFVSLSSKLRTWFGTLKKKEEEIGSESFTFQMKLLQKKLEDDWRSLEKQRLQMKDMMTANMDELRSERQAMIDQNQTLQDTIRSMNEAMERRNGQMLELQNQITELANRPPPSPPSGDGGCVIL